MTSLSRWWFEEGKREEEREEDQTGSMWEFFFECALAASGENVTGGKSKLSHRQTRCYHLTTVHCIIHAVVKSFHPLLSLSPQVTLR